MILFPKSGRERVQVGWNDYQGRRLLMARVFYTEDGGVTWKPGKNGLTLTPELMVPVVLALLRLTGVDTAEELARALEDAAILGEEADA